MTGAPPAMNTESIRWVSPLVAPKNGQRVLVAYTCPACTNVHVSDTEWTIARGFAQHPAVTITGWTVIQGPAEVSA